MDETMEQQGSIPLERSLVVLEPQDKVTVPDAVKPREIAYVIKDPYFGKFEVVKSDNAWWMERAKVENLILAFKNGHIVKAARYYAGISKDQWLYFLKIHPDFSAIKDDLSEVQMFKAMDTINESLKDPQTARWFLDRRHPMFAPKVKVESDEPLQQTINTNVSIGTINIDAREISFALRQIAKEVFGADDNDSGTITDEVMAGLDTDEHGQIHGGDLRV